MWFKCLLFLSICHQVFSQCFHSSFNDATCTLGTISAYNLSKLLRNIENLKKLLVFGDEDCREIEADTFKYTMNLGYIKIQNSKLDRLYEGTFTNIPLKVIDLSRNQLEYIEPRTFLNLPELFSLILRHNNLTTIHRGVFTKLPLEKLSLSYNHISSIETDAFDLYNLRNLQLDNNDIEFIDIHKVVSYPQVLETLWLHNNSITSVTRSMLHKLTHLKLLNLGFNMIRSVERGSFDATASLETLVLTNNRLTAIDGNIFPAQHPLKHLYLGYNRLMFLYPDFFDRLNALESVMLMGNPWICSCYDKINHSLSRRGISEYYFDKYYKLKTPLCISNIESMFACSYKYYSSLSEKYLTYLKPFSITFL